MTTTQVTGVHWVRGVEDRYPSVNDASLTYGTYDRTVDGDIISGYVATVVNGNEAAKADSTVNGGRFRGVFFTEVSADLDEAAGGAPPTVITGPALLFVRRRALKTGATYTKGHQLVAGTGADRGKMIDGGTGALTAASIGVIQDVQTDGILMRLFPANI